MGRYLRAPRSNEQVQPKKKNKSSIHTISSGMHGRTLEFVVKQRMMLSPAGSQNFSGHDLKTTRLDLRLPFHFVQYYTGIQYIYP